MKMVYFMHYKFSKTSCFASMWFLIHSLVFLFNFLIVKLCKIFQPLRLRHEFFSLRASEFPSQLYGNLLLTSHHQFLSNEV